MSSIIAADGALSGLPEGAITPLLCAIAALLALAGSYAGSAIVMRPVRALDPKAPWPERARWAYAPRLFTASNAVLPASIAGGIALGARASVSEVGGSGVFLLVALAAAIPSFYMRLKLEREIRGFRIPAGRWLRGGVVLTLLTLPHLLVALATNLAMPNELGPRAYATLAVSAALMFFLMRGGTLDVAQLLGVARRASPRLAAIVLRMSAKAGVAPSAVFELACPWANAYAYPLSGRLAFTDDALSALSDDEIAAVCAHELGHLIEPKHVTATRLIGAFTFALPVALARPLVASGGPRFFFYAVLAAYVAAVVVRVFFVRLYRRMETTADKHAHHHEGDAGTYARALTRIHEVNVMPVVMPNARGIHPNLYDRVAAAGAPMDSPRPGPPPRARAFLALAVSLGIMLVGIIVAWGVLPHRTTAQPAIVEEQRFDGDGDDARD